MNFSLRNLIGPALIILAAGPGGALAANAQDLRVQHGQGELVVSAVPQRVAVFDLATLDTLAALDLEAAVAGTPASFPAYLSVYRDERYQRVGSVFEPDIAALESLDPDLIIVGGRSRSAYEAVAAIAPTLDLSAGGGDFISQATGKVALLGEVFGVEERAADLIAELDAALAALHETSASAGTGLLIFAAGQGYNVQFPGSRFGAVYELFGIEPAFAPAAEEAPAGPRPEEGTPEAEAAAEAARERQQQVNADALAADPDWVFVIDRNAAFGETDLPERLAADPQVTATTAWENGQVVYLDGGAWYLVGGSGYTAMLSSVEAVAAAFAEAGL